MNNICSLPLEGITVLELATVVAAPTAARMLCSYGAEVIKVENLSGDDMRRAGTSEGVVCVDYKNPLFTVVNSGKKLTALNLKSSDGMEVFMRLLEQADVFITNVRSTSLVKLGLDYETLSRQLPRLIYAHFSGYGPKGPAAASPGFDSTAFWLRSGPISDWKVGNRPFTPTYAFGDMATSSAFLSGILMALLGRERTGRGTFVTTSLYASGIWCNAIAVIAAQSEGRQAACLDDELPSDPLSFAYCCKDGVWLGVYDNEYRRDREKFARILNMHELSDDVRYASLESLRESGALAECVKKIADIFMSKTGAEWQRYLTEENVACQTACSAVEVSCDQQALENGYVKNVDFADGLHMLLPEPPVDFSGYGRRQTVSAGRVGENTDAILSSLGYSEKEITAMREKNAVI